MSVEVVGLDIGGTKLAAALVDRDGSVTARHQVTSPAQSGPEAMVSSAADLVYRVVAAGGKQPLALGVATAGVVDIAERVITSAVDTIPGWAGVPLGTLLEDRTGLPTVIENDVNAIAIAEMRHGAARGARSALVAAVGTGVGGAIVLDGRLWRGRTGTAGEIGHLSVDAVDHARRLCSCGRPGHLEALTAGPAIARRYQALTGSSGALSLEDVQRAYREGDTLAASVIVESATLLGRGLGGLANVLDPEVIVLTGGVFILGELFFDPLVSALRAEMLPGPLGAAVVQGSLGPDAGIVGGAVIAHDYLDGSV